MAAPSRFFGKTDDETLALLDAARDYCALHEPHERARLTPLEGLPVSRETLRLTTRLVHIMSWLPAQEAVHAGEISRQDAAEEPYRLARPELCFEDGAQDEPALSPRLTKLLATSRQLCVCVARLDELVRRSADEAPRPFAALLPS